MVSSLKTSAVLASVMVCGAMVCGIGVATSANAACTSFAPHRWASKFDNILANTRGFQHPDTAYCLLYSARDSRNLQVENVLYPEGKKMVFVASAPGRSGARSELRSHPIPNDINTPYKLVGAAQIPGGQDRAQFTIGQLFAVDRNNTGRPLVRIEIDKGRVRAAIKTDLGTSDDTSSFHSLNSRRRAVNAGEVISYEIRQERINANDIRVTVKVEGETLFDGQVYGKGGDKNYFKLGCYVNNSTDINRCRAKFKKAQISPNLSVN